MNAINPWILAIRPKTLFASLGPVILGLAIVYNEFQQINISLALLTALCALLLQASSNLINDYYDGVDGKDSDERLGPLRVTSSGLIPAAQVKKAFILTLLVSFLIGSILMIHGGIPIIVIGLSSLFFAWAYTGGPFPLSRLGLGEIAAFIFFGPIPVWGTYFLQSKVHHDLPILFGFVPGFISAALMAVNNLRDRKEDKANGKKTIATILTEMGARYLVINFILLSAFFLPLVTREPKSLIVILPALLFFKNWKKVLSAPIDRDLNNVLANTGKYLFLQCLVHSIVILL
ncbi:MAG: 1,4-dihydroxy-2-naphthoate octaprenyltransferase [Oligoflexia bacterium]|nr:1,4-dihydroxy-2-naphthoate octaprenyltransferase [Oligoflexia bacterium]